MAKVYETNAIGPLIVVKGFLPLLKQAANVDQSAPMSCNRAAIINITTSLGSISENRSTGYYGHKTPTGAQNRITTNMGIYIKDVGILATAIHPGWVKTNMGGPNASIDTVTNVRGIMAVMEKLQGEEGTSKINQGESGDQMGW